MEPLVPPASGREVRRERVPSPASDQLTAEHRRQLGLLAVAVQRRAVSAAHGVDPSDIEAWGGRVSNPLVKVSSVAAAGSSRLASAWVSEHARLNEVDGLASVAAGPARAQIAASLTVS